MLAIGIAILILNLTVTYSRILLYNTENRQDVEKFDCVYHVYDDGEDISYCRRPGGRQSLNRNRIECDNEGEKNLFRDLLKQEIHPSIILNWSSSVEMADLYANVYYNRSLIDDNDDQFICDCTKRGTFGKYCEYQLTHDAESFSQAINTQFETKRNGDSWNTQRYGKILCYETLPCHSSPLCLDWREISDGVQRCSHGIDEENWDKLEFNECEDDEFRCTNGMCIPAEFWLDGDYDCMDWSDEYHRDDERSCPFEANAMECDEHVCSSGTYSCGDGQCVEWKIRMAFQRFAEPENDCFNKRNLNYMCEISPHRPAWTLESGLCWPDNGYDDARFPPGHMMNSSKLTNHEECQYLFRCVLSKGFEHDCPCNHRNCTQMMMNVCSSLNHLILYPPEGLINPNVGYRDFLSSYQNDKFCWNDSLTFNGRPYAVNPAICTTTGECISQYRIRDGFRDCFDQQDEEMVLDKNYCTGNVGRHRFQCFNDQRKCLQLIRLGTGNADCSNSYDESWYGIGTDLRLQLPCFKEVTNNCRLVKTYIQQSSIWNSNNNSSFVNLQQQESSSRMPFRRYCDSFWNLDNHIDEMPSSCQYWICQNDQYQCRTGQCIALDWVCDGEWDCSDASDEEAILLTENLSYHNARLPNLLSQIKKCRERYSKSPFSKICNTSFEFGCYLSRVSNPLDIQLNRPCINLTQIGDGLEDCYNAYDEKNTLPSIYYPIDENTTIRIVDHSYLHPKYQGHTDGYANVIALLGLNKPLNFNNNPCVTPICIRTTNTLRNISQYPKNGTRLAVIG
ncbi:unnamed protein product [Rotaria sp. Silwood1]|nr:unnamed protein product [Rotaria sp. Silwood1]CAF1422243.1 unnamed protein product [Rotaria sp. Silwood1]CAF3558223.1 unnamed protein product [Rotaria sp. Silwood1]